MDVWSLGERSQVQSLFGQFQQGMSLAVLGWMKWTPQGWYAENKWFRPRINTCEEWWTEEKDSAKEMDKSQPRRLGKILETVESCSHGKGMFQEGLGINNNENCTKLRMELYIFVPVSINMGFSFFFFFPCAKAWPEVILPLQGAPWHTISQPWI